ncbi:MAG: hypothetical protein JO154_15260 [Chitinophaga sp.]|uniref:hypothetical protein n=1 Tax=Chitinophaga sp. TaxID=1869181 RepID=UPI0025BA18A9|nr:hypothetical protein [Chitinophaga sp.]MBV8253960.1 hypothetical protein [Chitinophaga sp.]
MDKSFEINICIPLVPVYAPEIHLSEYVNNALKDILSLHQKIEINIEEIGCYQLNIIETGKEEIKVDDFRITADILTFQIIVPNTADKIEIITNNDHQISDEERLSLFIHMIVDEFKHQIFYLLVLGNLARPGGIKTREGVIYLNKEIFGSIPGLYSVHRESLDNIFQLKWPVYKTFDLIQVWNWMQINNFSFRSHSKTKVARALNAFTYLFKYSPENLVFDLFWSLIGIEALYCTSKEGISEQIYEKVQLVLGPVSESKKKIKGMYNFRSRLIHGDIDIPPNNFPYDDDPDDEKFQDELFNATILAVAILTTTLQEIILKNETDLKFKYVLE